MLKKCENPNIEIYTKTCKKRIFNLSSIRLPEGLKKKCVWCLGDLKGQQRRWCGDECVVAAQAWGNPQKEQGLYYLLIKQDWKCNICAFDWGAIINAMFDEPKLPYGFKEYKDTWRNKYSFWVATKLKDRMHATAPNHRLEVDHIIPIYKGGQSLGLDNHQAICYICHKEKTKKDNAGPRQVDPKKEYLKKLKKNYELVNGKLGERIRSVGYGNFSPDLFWTEIISMEELDLYIEYYQERYSENSHVDFKQRLASYKKIRIDKLKKPDQNGTEGNNG